MKVVRPPQIPVVKAKGAFMQEAEKQWHSLTGDAVLEELGTNESGLSNAEVAQRRVNMGPGIDNRITLGEYGARH
jgi:hypothetical protein